MELRTYQREAVDAVYTHLRNHDNNPCVVIPTGGGKTLVMATICRDAAQWGSRVLILAHVKELLEQIAEKLHTMAPDILFGIYSAGLKRRDLGYSVTIAGIQSVYQRADDIGPVDLVIVDEAHLIPPDGEGMYRQLLAQMRTISPQMRVIGLTATPYRMRSGMICAAENILNAICYEVGVRDLIEQGYLSKLRSKAGSQRPDYDQLHVRGGEYVADEVEDLMDRENLVASACREIVEHTADRKSVLIFASGLRHGEHIVRVLRENHNVECGFVCGETLPFERAETLRRFRCGNLKYLCNVNVLTTGFDAPNIDCVAIVRPTLSPGLYYQMVGRGFRTHPDKKDCLVLDFGGNVLRHGPIDHIQIDATGRCAERSPVKECPQCHEIIATGYAKCPQCGHEFQLAERVKHDATASAINVLSDGSTMTEHRVSEVFYCVHIKRNGSIGSPRTMRVDYRIGFNTYVSEWICVEHSGYPWRKAAAWWRARTNAPMPSTAEEAVEIANRGLLAEPTAITVWHVPGEKYDRIIRYKLGAKPPYPPALSEDGGAEETMSVCADDVPF